uniref:Uncharacterized protein n=1 Tax=Salmonella phage vB_STmST19_KE12 TaxID=3161166 RepID=A0AAU8GGT7_9CAUD
MTYKVFFKICPLMPFFVGTFFDHFLTNNTVIISNKYICK